MLSTKTLVVSCPVMHLRFYKSHIIRRSSPWLCVSALVDGAGNAGTCTTTIRRYLLGENCLPRKHSRILHETSTLSSHRRTAASFVGRCCRRALLSRPFLQVVLHEL